MDLCIQFIGYTLQNIGVKRKHNMNGKKYVLIILDGAADLARVDGKSPLQLARIPNIDNIGNLGVTGLMETLYDDLPRGSIVAQLGLLGYEPHKYYPHGRASCEAMALDVDLDDGDIALRANLVYVKNNILTSYNADYIESKHAIPIIKLLQNKLTKKFPEFELYHNSDFRNTLVLRDVCIHPNDLICLEPHENVGKKIILSKLIKGQNKKSNIIAMRINSYVAQTTKILKHERANAVIPWSASSALRLPRFSLLEKGKCGIITHMDFLQGIAKASGVDCFKIGNGKWNTDYTLKGNKLIELLLDNYRFVCCHINAPDEASHMADIQKKIYSIEQIDKHIVSQVVKYFKKRPKELGGVIVTTDHYTNTLLKAENSNRIESHSTNPVPFVLWNNAEQDNTIRFSEEDVIKGKYAQPPINHMQLLDFFS